MAIVKEATKGIIVKPCPCCGNTNLNVGPTSAMSMGVKCWCYGGGCGLELSVEYPEYWNSKKNVEVEMLKKAIKKWNKRVKV